MAPQSSENKENLAKFVDTLPKYENIENLSKDDCEFLVNGLNDAISVLENSTDNADNAIKLQTLTTLRDRLIDIGVDIARNGNISPLYQAQITEIFSDLNRVLMTMQTSSIDDKRKPKSTQTPHISWTDVQMRVEQDTVAGFARKSSPELLKKMKESPEFKELINTKIDIDPVRVSRLRELDLLMKVIDSLASDIRSPRTIGERARNYWIQYREEQQGRADKLEQLSLHLRTNGVQAIAQGMTVDQFLSDKYFGNEIKEIMSKFPQLSDLFDENGRLKDMKGPNDILYAQDSLLDFFREVEDYDGIRKLVEDDVMSKEFNEGRTFNASHILTEFNRAKNRASLRRMKLQKDMRSEWIKEFNQRGITDENVINTNINAFLDKLENEDAKRGMNMVTAQYLIDEGSISIDNPMKRTIWEKYVDIFNPKYDASPTKWSDKAWNVIYEELAYNLVPIIVTGLVAGAATRIVSSQALRLVEAWNLQSKLGLEIVNGGKYLGFAARTAKLTESATALNRAIYGLGYVSALGFEGAAFNAVHAGISHELFYKQPGWMLNIFWTSLTLGTFKFVDKAMGDLAKKAVLKFAENTSDKYLAEFIVKTATSYPIEIATMMMIGALQNGVEGTFDLWWEDIGLEFARSTSAVTGLKVAYGPSGVKDAKVKDTVARVGKLIDGLSNQAPETRAETSSKEVTVNSFLAELPPEQRSFVSSVFESRGVTPEIINSALKSVDPVKKAETIFALATKVKELEISQDKSKAVDDAALSYKVFSDLLRSNNPLDVLALEIFFNKDGKSVRLVDFKAFSDLYDSLGSSDARRVLSKILAKNIQFMPEVVTQLGDYLKNRLLSLSGKFPQDIFDLLKTATEKSLTPAEKAKLNEAMKKFSSDPSFVEFTDLLKLYSSMPDGVKNNPVMSGIFLGLPPGLITAITGVPTYIANGVFWTYYLVGFLRTIAIPLATKGDRINNPIDQIRTNQEGFNNLRTSIQGTLDPTTRVRTGGLIIADQRTLADGVAEVLRANGNFDNLGKVIDTLQNQSASGGAYDVSRLMNLVDNALTNARQLGNIPPTKLAQHGDALSHRGEDGESFAVASISHCSAYLQAMMNIARDVNAASTVTNPTTGVVTPNDPAARRIAGLIPPDSAEVARLAGLRDAATNTGNAALAGEYRQQISAIETRIRDNNAKLADRYNNLAKAIEASLKALHEAEVALEKDVRTLNKNLDTNMSGIGVVLRYLWAPIRINIANANGNPVDSWGRAISTIFFIASAALLAVRTGNLPFDDAEDIMISQVSDADPDKVSENDILKFTREHFSIYYTEGAFADEDGTTNIDHGEALRTVLIDQPTFNSFMVRLYKDTNLDLKDEDLVEAYNEDFSDREKKRLYENLRKGFLAMAGLVDDSGKTISPGPSDTTPKPDGSNTGGKKQAGETQKEPSVVEVLPVRIDNYGSKLADINSKFKGNKGKYSSLFDAFSEDVIYKKANEKLTTALTAPTELISKQLTEYLSYLDLYADYKRFLKDYPKLDGSAFAVSCEKAFTDWRNALDSYSGTNVFDKKYVESARSSFKTLKENR